MNKPPLSIRQLRRHYQQLKADLMRVDGICQGTALARYEVRRASKPGPYYQWTRKQKNKTQTVNLSVQQYRRLQRAIAQNHKVENLLRRMRELSEVLVFQTTPDIQRRKPLKFKVLHAI